MHGPWQCTFLNRVQNHLRCSFLHVFGKQVLEMHVFARFCTFLHIFAHCMYLRYTNTCYKVLTFNSTDFLFLNTVLHTTDLIIHDFELHELFNVPKMCISRPYCKWKINSKWWKYYQSCPAKWRRILKWWKYFQSCPSKRRRNSKWCNICQSHPTKQRRILKLWQCNVVS